MRNLSTALRDSSGASFKLLNYCIYSTYQNKDQKHLFRYSHLRLSNYLLLYRTHAFRQGCGSGLISIRTRWKTFYRQVFVYAVFTIHLLSVTIMKKLQKVHFFFIFFFY
jgi:hypothetical protein